MKPTRIARSIASFLLPFLLVAILPALAGAQTDTSTPPPTPVLVPGGSLSPSPFPTTLRTPEPSLEPPEIRAGAAVLADLDSGQVLFAQDPHRRRPIASLTKIMTALLVLERSDRGDVVTVSDRAAGDGPTAGISELGLVAGERISVDDLLYALLLQSANDAAIALAEHVAGSVDAFVSLMNRRAHRLGLSDTEFFSPNGLDDRGYSSASDLVRLTRAAYRQPGFGDIVATEFKEIPAPENLPPRIVQNRNVLLWLYPGAVGAKTGYTSEAGYCVVAVAEREGLRLIAVVLGEPGEPFSDAAALLDYGFTAFERRQVIASGMPLGVQTIDGHEVPVASGGSLVGLVPVDAVIRRHTLLDPAVSFPPLPGERAGRVVVSVPGLRIGEVPLVVVSVPPPPPPDDAGPWWGRAVSAVTDAVGLVLDVLVG